MKVNETQIDSMFPDRSIPLKKIENMYFDYNDNGLYVKDNTGRYIRIGGTTTSTSSSTSTSTTTTP